MGCGASHPDDGGRPESTKHTMKEAPELIDDFDTRANGSLSKSSMRLGQLSKSRLDTHVQREMLQLPDEKALGTMRKRSRALSVAPRARRMSSIINTFESSIMGLLGSDGDDDFDDADDTERLRSLFDLIAATNASGDNDTITLSALTGGFRRMGWQKKSAEVTKIFQFADTDNSGKIEWPEFQNFFKHIVSDIKPCGDDYTVCFVLYCNNVKGGEKKKDYQFSQIEFQQTKKSKRTVLACGFFPAFKKKKKKSNTGTRTACQRS